MATVDRIVRHLATTVGVLTLLGVAACEDGQKPPTEPSQEKAEATQQQVEPTSRDLKPPVELTPYGQTLDAAQRPMVSAALVPASENVGDVAGTVTLPLGSFDVSITFDGERLFYAQGTDLVSFEPEDPSGTVQSVGVTDAGGTALDLDAMSYDGTRDLIWAVEHGTENIYQVEKSTGNATFQFSATGKCTDCIGSFKDGLAFDAGDPADPSDDAIWWSYDVDSEVYKLDLSGNTLESFLVDNVDSRIVRSSGIEVGGPWLFLANNGLDDIFRVEKATKTLEDLFAEDIGARPEDLACDPVTFEGVDVVWARRLQTDELPAFVIPDGSCGVGGLPPDIGVVVDIDIKPNSDPNALNPNSRGTTPVAILHTDDFDPATVDVSTVRFGDPEDVDMDTGAQPAHPGGHFEDYDKDGDDDLILHFPTQDADFEGDEKEGKLVGKTDDGTPIEGTDTVKLTGGGPS